MVVESLVKLGLVVVCRCVFRNSVVVVFVHFARLIKAHQFPKGFFLQVFPSIRCKSDCDRSEHHSVVFGVEKRFRDSFAEDLEIVLQKCLAP